MGPTDNRPGDERVSTEHTPSRNPDQIFFDPKKGKFELKPGAPDHAFEVHSADEIESGRKAAGGRGNRQEEEEGRESSQIEEWGVYVYIDSSDEEKIGRVVGFTDELLGLLGFGSPFDIRVQKGSFIRISRVRRVKGDVTSEMRSRQASLERVAMLYAVDEKQAQVDAKFAAVVAGLVDALREVPNACIRAGATLLIKYEDSGRQFIQSRKLTDIEVQAIERYPEIQNDPRKALLALAMAVDKIGSRASDVSLDG
jgi:hypothetical protein